MLTDIEKELYKIRGDKKPPNKPKGQIREKPVRPIAKKPEGVRPQKDKESEVIIKDESKNTQNEQNVQKVEDPIEKPMEIPKVEKREPLNQPETSDNNVINTIIQNTDTNSFKVLSGLFTTIPGDSSVRIEPNLKRSQVSGIPDSLITIIQEKLKSNIGKVIKFPWPKEYVVKSENKVFTNKTSLIRYLLFNSLRDKDGSHIQYAKQWFYLNVSGASSDHFDHTSDISITEDSLDIYALIILSGLPYNENSNKIDSNNTKEFDNMNLGLSKILAKIDKQDKQLERNQLIQNIILLDRMGLLKGGLPKDMKEFIYILESNRAVFENADKVLNKHIQGEDERKATLMRDNKMVLRNRK